MRKGARPTTGIFPMNKCVCRSLLQEDYCWLKLSTESILSGLVGHPTTFTETEFFTGDKAVPFFLFENHSRIAKKTIARSFWQNRRC